MARKAEPFLAKVAKKTWLWPCLPGFTRPHFPGKPGLASLCLAGREFGQAPDARVIEDITSNCETIFTVQDLISTFPVFIISNSLRVLEVIQEVFMDIPNLKENLSFMNLYSVPEVLNVNSRVHEWFDFDEIDLGVESDNDSVLLEI